MRLRDRFDRSKRTPSTRTQRIGFALFWLLVVSYAYFISSAASFNSESHLYPAFALVDRHTIRIDAYATRLEDKSYWKGHYYTDKAPGLSFLAVPPYAALRLLLPSKVGRGYDAVGRVKYSIPKTTVYIRYAITYVLVILPSAILSILLWLFLSRFVSQRWALGVTLAYALGTIAFPYSAWFYSHQITAVLLFGAFLLIFARVRGAPGSRQTYLSAALAGLLAGYAIISEYPTAVIAGLVGLYLVAVATSKARAAAAYVAGMLPPAALNAGYNLAAYGKPFATGYAYVHSTLYHVSIHTGPFGLSNPLSYGVQAPTLDSLWQITLGTYRGLFFLSPVLLLFFAGAFFMWRRRELRAEWALCVAVVALYLLLDASRPANVNGWTGGTSVASRHLVPMLPFMVVPIVFGLGNRPFRVAFLALGSVSVLVMFLVMASGGGSGFPYGDKNPLFNEVLPHLARGHIEVNWGYLTGQMGVPSLFPLAILLSGLSARIIWLFWTAPRSAPQTAMLIPEYEAS